MAMTRSRKVLLVIILLVLLADFLPATREELSWWWAESHDHSANYLHYLSVWPAGRHLAAARILYEERQRTELVRTQIRQANDTTSQTKTEIDAAYRREQQTRRDRFFWKQASTANTIESYNNYLREFPQGSFSAQARKCIQALSQPATGPNK
jgi:hypothetical protein